VRTGGVSFLVRVTELRATLDRVNDGVESLTKPALNGLLPLLVRSKILQPVKRVVIARGGDCMDVQAEDGHHVAHLRIQRQDLLVVVSPREFEGESALED
jgi:hypothetical protein